MKAQTAWAIYTGELLLPFLIRSTRRKAIQDAMEHIVDGKWEIMRHQGYSVRRVVVTPCGQPAGQEVEG